MKNFAIYLFFCLCISNVSFSQDANNPIDPSPTAGLFMRSYENDFLRVQFIGNIAYKKWFFRVSAEEQFDYNSENQRQFKGANFLVARLFQSKDGNHNFGVGGIVSYIDPKGMAGGINVVTLSKFGQFRLISLTTYQAGKDISTMEFQPGIYYDLPKGWYLRSHPRMLFDFETNFNEIPLGAGFGKIIKSSSVVTNLFLEPQYDLAQNRAIVYFGTKFLF